MTHELRAELKRLSEKATPAPWHAADRGIGWEVHVGEPKCQTKGSGWCDSINEEFRDTMIEENAQLIVFLRNHVPDLLDALDRLAVVETIVNNIDEVKTKLNRLEWAENRLRGISSVIGDARSDRDLRVLKLIDEYFAEQKGRAE